MEERKPFQQMMLEPWSSMSKNPKPNILVKIHSKSIMNLNVKCKAIQTSRKNIGESLQDLRLEKEFSDLRTKA